MAHNIRSAKKTKKNRIKINSLAVDRVSSRLCYFFLPLSLFLLLFLQSIEVLYLKPLHVEKTITNLFFLTTRSFDSPCPLPSQPNTSTHLHLFRNSFYLPRNISCYHSCLYLFPLTLNIKLTHLFVKNKTLSYQVLFNILSNQTDPAY